MCTTVGAVVGLVLGLAVGGMAEAIGHDGSHLAPYYGGTGAVAGITIVTGIVSAMTGRPVRNDIAMTGEITIMGKVLAIGGALPKLQAAIDAGCQEVIMPKENERDVQMTPDYVRDKIKVRFVSSIEEVLEAALLKT